MDPQTPHRVLVAGGGVAGLEALLALRELAGDRVALTLLSPEREFTYRPMSTAVPFARGHMQRHDLADLAREVGAELVHGVLAEVDVEGSTVLTTDGHRLGYDSLLVAVGAASEPVYRRVPTWTPELDQEVFGGLLADLESGYAKRVAFVIPPGSAWPLPAYELALMTAWDVRDMGQEDVEVTVYTPEDAPLAIFGTEASAALRADLDEAGVKVETGVVIREDALGERLAGQRVVALPRATSREIRGLPADARGFLRVSERDLQVEGTDNVWAAGDAIAYPIKQGGLAAQQADAAAQAIAAAAGAGVEPMPFRPVLRGVLLTGRGARWIRRDPRTGERGETERRALWWPPTKVAGRYLAPYLSAAGSERPAGTLVDFEPTPVAS